ncbi:MAG: DEAD/DEAH box helicase [Deltaproteobacteria bacterium]|nr:DEAD/DEAH box helicase [Deltaproteobacteria bacterium]
MESLQQKTVSELGHYYVELDNNLASKIDFLVNFLEANYGKKTGIFCPLPSDVDLLETILRKKGLLLSKLIGHVSFAKVASVFDQLEKGEIVGALLTDVSSKHVDLGAFDYLIIFSPSADPSIYYQRCGIASGNSPRIGVVTLVATQDLVNFQYLKKASGLHFELYSMIRGDVSENRRKILSCLLGKFLDTFQPEERILDFSEKLMENQDLLRRSIPLLLDSFVRNLPAEQERTQEARDSLPRKSHKVSVKEARLFINLGSAHQFTESALKALLDQGIENGAQHLIRVSIRRNYSFFDVVDFVSDELVEKLNKITWNGNVVAVRLAIRLNPLRSEVGGE